MQPTLPLLTPRTEATIEAYLRFFNWSKGKV